MHERVPFAEVIGDPVAHSLSPAIHLFWLEALRLEGEYRAELVSPAALPAHLAGRRDDPSWRGCNVTAPLKEAVVPLLDRLDADAEAIGAVNCVIPREGALTGFNTDVDGVRHAIGGAELPHGRAVIIGAGGAARAAIVALRDRDLPDIVILARRPNTAIQLAEMKPGAVQVLPFSRAGDAIRDATLIVNASPLGMPHVEPMPNALLGALAGAAPGATVLDMVYAPLETPLLAAARAGGLRPVDGLAMLIGQARRAFELFFGVAPPEHDDALRRQLTA